MGCQAIWHDPTLGRDAEVISRVAASARARIAHIKSETCTAVPRDLKLQTFVIGFAQAHADRAEMDTLRGKLQELDDGRLVNTGTGHR